MTAENAPQIPDPTASPTAKADGDYVVVARRYRPQTFDELIGQQHVAKALEGAITSNRVGHAYLFTGARGVGKTSAARILAKALDCVDGPAPVPCNQCDICQSISTGDDVDVLEIDGASNRGIDEIRQLRSNVKVRPSRARFKIYIIDEVHMLTREAFNALLKTLEEPPEHVKFIFCTTEPNKIPITVLSRCQRFDFAGIQADSIVERLAQIAASEGVAADSEALEILARRAAGSMRDSQSLLEQLLACGGERISVADVHTLLGTADSTRVLALAEQITSGDAAGALSQLDDALDEGVEVGQLLEQLLGIFRDCMVALTGCGREAYLHAVSSRDQEAVGQLSDQLGLQTTLALLQVLEHAVNSLRYTTQGRTVAEVALVRACHLKDLDQLADLVAELRGSEGSTSGGNVPKRSAPAAAAKKKSETTKSAEPQPEILTAPSREDRAVESSTPLAAPLPAVEAKPAELPTSEEHAKEIWEQALAKLSGMVTAKAGAYDRLAMPAPNRLVVSFPETYNLCKSFCERPDQFVKIQRALQEVTGNEIHVDFSLSAAGSREGEAAPKKPVSRQKQLATVAANPLVRRAGELFGARPVDVTRPR